MFETINRKLKSIPDYVAFFRPWFGLRLYFRNILTLPTVLKTKRGSWVYLGPDRVDDHILKDLNLSLRDAYFPSGMHLTEKDIVLDVGAHHGIFALELTSQFSGIQVYSFEPDRLSFNYLRFNKGINFRKNIDAINAALDKEKSLLYIVKSHEGSWGNYVTKEKTGNASRITTISVQDFVEQKGITKVKYAKFNAEGAEFIVIPELFRLSLFPEYLLVFAHPEKGNVSELLDLIRKHDYQLRNSTDDKNRPWYLFVKN